MSRLVPRRLAGELPRDGRDTLFLLAVIGWILLPQVARLPLWCSLLAGAVLLWRGWIALGARPLPSRWWLAALLALTLGLTLMSHRTLLGRDAGVTLLVSLLALKTLELRARRDAFVVFFLGFFTMLTNFFFSQSLVTAAAMLVGLLGLLTALVNAHMPVGRPPLAESARHALRMATVGAPIMLVLFLLFPRLAPLWGIPSDAMSGRSGLSSTMEVGNLASLALDDSIAMRIRFDGQPPLQGELYFRGPVLSEFDGRQWRQGRGDYSFNTPPQRNLQLNGAPTAYEVTLEPHNRPWLLLLDVASRRPELAGLQALQTQDLAWLANRPITDLVRYRAQSHTDFRYGPQRRTAELQADLQLPPGRNPRTLALAAELRRDPRYAEAGSAVLVAAALERLRTGGYSYTLEPGVYGEHTADEFWFDRKEGFCEHIASAFVVLMRALDVPARIVTGYQGGEMNAVDGYWTVRQSDAHAWTEVWHAGQGWVRVDPTGAVAPGRIGSLQRLRAPQGAFATAVGNVNPNVAAQLRAAWEAVNNRWNQWVLNYTQSRQLDLLRALGFDAPDWQDLGRLLAALLVLASLGGVGWTLWERRQHDPWLRLLHQARERLRAAGLAVPPQAAPRQLALLLVQLPAAAAGPQQLAPLRDWLLRLEAQRYARGPALELATLRREYRRLPWPTPTSPA
ncbi:transglutaminase [Pseudorhodoferax sp. Leaf274]|nr:transglutaminase [Pseudorhodoferax sp. Leaf274]